MLLPQISKNRLRACLLAFAALFAGATQVLDVHDGGTVSATISARESTRIKIEGARIGDLYGSVHTDKNPTGELEVLLDKAKGEIFVQPAVIGATKPINVFVSTDKATYTLVLTPLDVPADTLILRDRTGLHDKVVGGPNVAYIRDLKHLLVGIVSDTIPPEITVTEQNRIVPLWKEVRYSLVRRYEGHPRWVGERYHLVNISDQPMTLNEREFFSPGVAAVAVEPMQLAPGEMAKVSIIREQDQGAQP